MSSPAGRVLALLERVQERPGLTASRLAEDLGVSERTVRRYVTTLQDLGIPVEAERGRYGGHRLRPGYRMPPLMLSTDEAVAITLALAVGRADAGDAAGTALAKLQHALPRGVSDQVADVLAVVRPPGQGQLAGGAPDPGVLAALATGVVERRRCRVRYRGARGGDTSVREVNPYGVALVQHRLYLHGWCHLRQGRRTFRVDRIESAELLTGTFRMPVLDVAAAVERSLALARPEWSVSLLLHGPIEEVEQWVPGFLGVCERVDDSTTRVRSSTSNPDYFVLRISDHPFDMTVESPDAVRRAFERAATRMAATAERNHERSLQTRREVTPVAGSDLSDRSG